MATEDKQYQVSYDGKTKTITNPKVYEERGFATTTVDGSHVQVNKKDNPAQYAAIIKAMKPNKPEPPAKKKVDSGDIAANKKISSVVEKANNDKSVLENVRSSTDAPSYLMTGGEEEESTEARIVAPSQASFYTK